VMDWRRALGGSSACSFFDNDAMMFHGSRC
jgi:hypothetical protein